MKTERGLKGYIKSVVKEYRESLPALFSGTLTGIGTGLLGIATGYLRSSEGVKQLLSLEPAAQGVNIVGVAPALTLVGAAALGLYTAVCFGLPLIDGIQSQRYANQDKVYK